MEKFSVVLKSIKDELCSEFAAFFGEFKLSNLEDEEFVEELFMAFPFVELCYVLDKEGVQISDNFDKPYIPKEDKPGR